MGFRKRWRPKEGLRDAGPRAIHGLRLSRLLSMIPLVIYGVGILAILVGSVLGYWELTFHPDRLFPFEIVGLSACALVFWRGWPSFLG